MAIVTAPLDYAMFDCDNHCYEQPDSFTRYIDPKFRDRAVTHGDGVTTKAAIGTRPITATDSPSLAEGVAVRPGSLKEYLRKLKKGDASGDYEFGPMLRGFQYRDARLEMMDQQGVESCLLFPSTAITVESFMDDDDDVLYANFHAFNRWLDEEWGWNHQGRVYAPPYIPLRNLEKAVAETEWAIENGARIVSMRPGHAYGRSPADPYFDPIWARLNEAGVAVAYHLTECGYSREISVNWSEDPEAQFWGQSAWQWTNLYCDRAIMDTLSALVLHNLFGRFPNVRAISVEHGAEWFPYLVQRMDKMRGMGRNGRWVGGPLKERPSEVCKRHVFVTAFPEDDVEGIVARIGAESICLGSDFPHAEGCTEPREFLHQIDALSSIDRRKILRDNGRRVVGVPV